MRRAWVAFNRYLDDRFNMTLVRDFVDKQAHKRLPPHTGWWHIFGSLSLIAYISQVLTGILLLIYYRPTADEAFESVKYITEEVHFGWLYRQLHILGATLMIVALIIHMARTFFMGAYKKPRELTWVVGAVIFVVTIVFGFTGYLLPWNQLAYWATTVGTELAAAVPWVGPWLKTMMLGGHNVSGETLARFFTIHVIILPWTLGFLVAIHLVLMRANNLATMEPVGEERPYPPESGVPFWPVHVCKEGCVIVVTFAVLITLAVFLPMEVGEPASPLETPEAIKPEWYFLPTYQLLKYFTGPMGKIVGIGVSTIPFLLLFIWPFLDRSRARHPKKRPIAVTLGIIGIISALGLGLLGHWSETHRTFFGETYEFDVYGVPHRVDEAAAESPATAPGEVESSSPHT